MPYSPILLEDKSISLKEVKFLMPLAIALIPCGSIPFFVIKSFFKHLAFAIPTLKDLAPSVPRPVSCKKIEERLGKTGITTESC